MIEKQPYKNRFPRAAEIFPLMKVADLSEMIPGIDLEGLQSSSDHPLMFLSSRRLSQEEAEWNAGDMPSQYFDGVMDLLSPSLTEEEVIERAKKAFDSFDDQIIIDLGAGRTAWPYRILAMPRSPKAYIGVDASEQNADALWHDIGSEQVEFANGNRTASESAPPAAVVAEDILTFLRRLPDNSVSIFMGGVDRLLIHDQGYWDSMSKEIERVLSSEGGYIALAGSHVEPPKAENISTEVIKGSSASLVVYKKT